MTSTTTPADYFAPLVEGYGRLIDHLAAQDTADAVAALVREVRAGDVAHCHVARVAGESDTDHMERVYAAGHAALAVATEDGGYSAWTGTEHYGHGICWQWIHLPSGHRIALTWLG